MKIGQKVKIKDGSYMMTVTPKGIAHNSEEIKCIGMNQDIWTIIAKNCKLPTDNNCNFRYGLNGDIISNNTIIRNDSNGEVWFCVENISLQEIKSKFIPIEILKLEDELLTLFIEMMLNKQFK